MKTHSLLFVFCAFLYGNLVSSCSQQKLNVKIGVCTSVNKSDLLATAGCSYVEVGIRSFFVPDQPDSVFTTKLQEARKSVLPLYSGNGFFPGEIQLIGPGANKEVIKQYAATALERASQTGTKIFVLGSGKARNIPDGFSRAEATQQFTALCKDLAILAAPYDITIVIEPLQSSETNFINTVREGTAIAKAVNHPNLAVLADFFHMMRENEDAGALIEAGKLLKHCHIAEKEERTPPGVKKDDFRPYFRALRQMNYQGGISIECRWKDFNNEVVPAVSEIKRQISEIN